MPIEGVLLPKETGVVGVKLLALCEPIAGKYAGLVEPP